MAYPKRSQFFWIDKKGEYNKDYIDYAFKQSPVSRFIAIPFCIALSAAILLVLAFMQISGYLLALCVSFALIAVLMADIIVSGVRVTRFYTSFTKRGGRIIDQANDELIGRHSSVVFYCMNTIILLIIFAYYALVLYHIRYNGEMHVETETGFIGAIYNYITHNLDLDELLYFLAFIAAYPFLYHLTSARNMNQLNTPCIFTQGNEGVMIANTVFNINFIKGLALTGYDGGFKLFMGYKQIARGYFFPEDRQYISKLVAEHNRKLMMYQKGAYQDIFYTKPINNRRGCIMQESELKKYAKLLVSTGGNVQKGQLVVISSSVDDAYFTRIVEKYAYDAGASNVETIWVDDVSTRTKYRRAADPVFDEYPNWQVDRYSHYDEKGAVYIAVRSKDPDLLKSIDSDRIKRQIKVSQIALKDHMAKTMSNTQRWTIAALPSPPWAAKVFPGLSEDEAMKKLWGCIIKGARAGGRNPAKDWAKHKKNFEQKVNYLNSQSFASLKFTNSIGTNFTVGLAKNHIWRGGGTTGKDGVEFFPNIPTEEIFTSPDRASANGRVVASLPLSYQGSLIEKFELTFKDGKVVSWKAKKNKKTLTNILEMDQGAKQLGEVAIVPSSSPIAQMNTLFYETLFDENASCHLALGKAYPGNIKDGGTMNEEELLAAGVNDSIIHVDFMFGTPDMQITGIKEDGTEIEFYVNGDFAI